MPPGSLQTAETFATGSWDNEENHVSLWSIGDFGNPDSDGSLEGDHRLLCDIKHHGDVMDLQFFDQERIVAASSTGCVTIFLHHPNNQTLSVSQQWTTAHYHTGPGSPSYCSAPCTGVVCDNPEIVTVGEDGRINLFRADHKEAVRTIDNADSSTLHAVTFLRTPEILTVNSIGQLKIWDFRQQGNEPSQILSLTGDRVPLHCVDRHPNQQHVVATGGQDGMLSIWDVRQGTMPVSLLKAHEAEMWEVHFHPPIPIISSRVLKTDPSGTGMPPQMSLKSHHSFIKEEELVLFCLMALITRLMLTSLLQVPGSAPILQKTELKSPVCFPVGLCL